MRVVVRSGDGYGVGRAVGVVDVVGVDDCDVVVAGGGVGVGVMCDNGVACGVGGYADSVVDDALCAGAIGVVAVVDVGMCVGYVVVGVGCGAGMHVIIVIADGGVAVVVVVVLICIAHMYAINVIC